MRRMMIVMGVVAWVTGLWILHFAIVQTATSGVQPVSQEGLRIFVSGQSFHKYIWMPLWELAREAGLKDNGRWMPQYIGDASTLEQWNLPGDNNRTKELLAKGKVDVLTLAPLTFPDPGIENFVEFGLAHNPNMRFTVQLSWNEYDGDNQTNHVDHNKTPEQLQALAQPNIKAAEAQVARINKQAGRQVVFLVPAAQAVIALRTKIYNKEIPGLSSQDQLFMDAMGHPAPPLQALNEYLHYAVIYSRSPVGLPPVGAMKYASNKAWDGKLNLALQKLAWETVTKYPFNAAVASPEVKQCAALN